MESGRLATSSNIILKKSQVRCWDCSSPDLFVIIVLCLIIVQFPGAGIRREREDVRRKGISARYRIRIFARSIIERERHASVPYFWVAHERKVQRSHVGRRSTRMSTTRKVQQSHTGLRSTRMLTPKKVQQTLAVADDVDKVSPADAGRRRQGQQSKPSGRWPSTTRSTKKVQRTLAVNDKVDKVSPADAGRRQ